MHSFLERDIPRATVEGLLLLKLYALPALYREGDTQRIALYETDMTMLIDRYRPKIAPILTALQTHVDEGAFIELQRIAAEIEERVRRMDQRKASQSQPNPSS